jgi:hypothetical protein
VVGALFFADSALAWRGDAARARAGLDRAVAQGRVAAIDAERYRGDLARASAVLPTLPRGRAQNLAAILHDVAVQAPRYDAPRTLALFSTLRVNADYLARNDMPPKGKVVTDADGVAYRSFPGRGLRFHPLASFGRLNTEITNGNFRAATRLGYALVARGNQRNGELVWEYYFRFNGGTPPWTSGMAQAVAAQSLARLGLRDEARLAYRAIPRSLTRQMRAGPWIRLYSFDNMAVLNAQLQAAISIQQYANLTGDPHAKRLVVQLARAAREMLPRFDTGFWSLYALGGREADLHYHQYVVSLLWKLSGRTGNRAWADDAARLRDYWRKPPYVEPRGKSPVVYPVPADGFKDHAEIRFWVSKPAVVTIRVAGMSWTHRRMPGVHTFSWWPGERRPGTYNVHISAVDRVGNRFARSVRPVEIRRDTVPPEATATVVGATLAWEAVDEATPWVNLRLVLQRGGARRVVDLGNQALSGTTELELPVEKWHATLVVADSSENRTRVPLGTVGGLEPFPPGLGFDRRSAPLT